MTTRRHNVPHGQQPQGNQPAMAQPPPFVLTPALLNNGPIDYSMLEGIKIFRSNIDLLEYKYDLATANLKVFLESVRQRSRLANWWSILMMQQSGREYNLIDHYGILTKETVKNNVATYLNQMAEVAGRKA